MNDENTNIEAQNPQLVKRPLVVPLEEGDHAKLTEIGRKHGLQKATYVRMVILAAIENPERFAPALVAKG